MQEKFTEFIGTQDDCMKCEMCEQVFWKLILKIFKVNEVKLKLNLIILSIYLL